MGESWNRPERFRPDEIDAATSAGDQAREMATARELEWLAATDDIAPSAGFTDRVMAAVAAEPTPRPVVAAASAARRGAVLGVLSAFGDLWRVAWTGGRPMAVRAPAMAIVAVVLVASLGGGALGVGALSAALDRSRETASPTQVVSPEPTDSPESSESPEPSGSPDASESPEASESPDASGSPADSASPDASESPGATHEPTGTPRATATPRPTNTPPPTGTPEPTDTPHPSDSPPHE